MLFDFHSHILPNIDDGSQSLEQSMSMLSILSDSKIQTVLATPHYYIDRHTIDDFLKRREDAYQKLSSFADLSKYPDIIKGAEVLLTSELCDTKDLHRLCIENTNYILIEMPYTYWSDWVYYSIYKIIAEHNLVPIIAHIERYIKLVNDKNKIEKLLNMDVMTQMNAYSIVERSSQREALKLVKNGSIHVIGSDAHNDTTRAPKIAEAFAIIRKKLGQRTIDELNENAKYILT